MSLRTAPCPRCQALIVFGERQCRTCAMPFDYGPNPPPVPSPEQVFDVLMSADLPPLAPVPTTSPASSTPSTSGAVARASSTPPVDAVGTLPGLDSGRASSVGDVVVEDIPGFIDSTLFAAMTPRDAAVSTMPGLEFTHAPDVQVPSRLLSDIDGVPVPVGDVVTDTVPGLFGSDLFRADVDVAAGAAHSPALDVTNNLRPTRRDDEARRVVCASCATVHHGSRCPSCGTVAADVDDG